MPGAGRPAFEPTDHERKAYPGMRADFSGLDIADRFLFGCGMDYKGYWRNAPGIYAVKGL